jgi:hypothetical protein
LPPGKAEGGRQHLPALVWPHRRNRFSAGIVIGRGLAHLRIARLYVPRVETGNRRAGAARSKSEPVGEPAARQANPRDGGA